MRAFLFSGRFEYQFLYECKKSDCLVGFSCFFGVAVSIQIKNTKTCSLHHHKEKAMNNTKLLEVLKPSNPAPLRIVKALEPANEFQETLIKKAARQVRDIYVEGQVRMGYDPREPERFFDACVDTWMAYSELSDALADEKELAVVNAVFEEAGFLRDRVFPTTLRAQVEMQITAVEFARKFKTLFATQQSLGV